MATTTEVRGIETARAALADVAASATTFLDSADAAVADARAAREEAAGLLQAAESMRAAMEEAEVDSETLAEVAAMQEQAALLISAAEQLEAAAARLSEVSSGLNAAADTAKAGLNARHSGVEDAHKAAPEGGAKKDFYV